jgi:hypothetical protein
VSFRKTSRWKRQQTKMVARSAKKTIFRHRVMRGMDTVRGGPRYNLGNRRNMRLMNKHKRKKH